MHSALGFSSRNLAFHSQVGYDESSESLYYGAGWENVTTTITKHHQDPPTLIPQMSQSAEKNHKKCSLKWALVEIQPVETGKATTLNYGGKSLNLKTSGGQQKLEPKRNLQ